MPRKDLINSLGARAPLSHIESGSTSTGAAISARNLVIMTVSRSDSGFTLCPAASAQFEHQGRDQSSLLQLHEDLNALVRRSRIRRIYVRVAPERGQYASTASGYKSEALLQLLTGVRTELVYPATILAWVRKYGDLAPAPALRLKSQSLALHRAAIATACMAAEGSLSRSLNGTIH
ncbi:MAG TPA: DUF3010 family protein [Allosphingosinicella sp.]|nr:DUF3010 family protein [Allosphingosinicella sp.]